MSIASFTSPPASSACTAISAHSRALASSAAADRGGSVDAMCGLPTSTPLSELGACMTPARTAALSSARREPYSCSRACSSETRRSPSSSSSSVCNPPIASE
eukprot:6564762-Prymnesium_polylepis.1